MKTVKEQCGQLSIKSSQFVWAKLVCKWNSGASGEAAAVSIIVAGYCYTWTGSVFSTSKVTIMTSFSLKKFRVSHKLNSFQNVYFIENQQNNTVL